MITLPPSYIVHLLTQEGYDMTTKETIFDIARADAYSRQVDGLGDRLREANKTNETQARQIAWMEERHAKILASILNENGDQVHDDCDVAELLCQLLPDVTPSGQRLINAQVPCRGCGGECDKCRADVGAPSW